MRALRIVAFAAMASMASINAASALCGGGDTTTGSASGATVTFVGNTVNLCPTQQNVLWGLYGSPDGATNPNIDVYNNFPMTTAGGDVSASPLNVTTAKGTYTLTPVDSGTT